MINKITCESKKIVSKLLNVGVENNRKLFQGNGVIISTNDIDKMEINYKFIGGYKQYFIIDHDFYSIRSFILKSSLF